MQRKELSVILPCYNEADTIKSTIDEINQTLTSPEISFEIIVVDDASKDRTSQILSQEKNKKIKIISNPYRIGYGASIKAGIKKSRYSWVGICDADGTYPVNKFLDFLKFTEDYDMVVGERTGKIRSIPRLRRPTKWFLNCFSSYLTRRKIKDVNSGLRIFKKEVAYKYWNLFPDGFSFTTTLTLSLIMGHHPIKNISIEYHKRKGKSKINPFRDTYNFFLLILRISMLFNPLRVFMPAFFIIFFMTGASLIRDIYNLNLTDTTVMLFIFSIIILMIGLLADLIIKAIIGHASK